MNQQSPGAPSKRTRVRRLAERAHYDQKTLYEIIDAAYLCNIAFNDGESTHCIPTACWRQENYLYVHGSNGGRLTKVLTAGIQVSIAITHLDGLVLARSAFNHTMNYRSAVIYGTFEIVDGSQQKMAALDAFMDKIAAGRKHEARPGDANELAATSVLRISLAEAAAKINNTGPEDKPEDLDLPVWAGILPMSVKYGEPIQSNADQHNSGDIPTPAYVQEWTNRS
ncbi:MAG: pyridoxamine 5'-phosphate oxidase family protein [Cellvibrio sp.]|uniref:pyridoxamine 5'-phosphate oxidase family protein n=1 Tax=Cellvibrio sp. TaxID=1965322 RepID=UPI0031AC8268